MIISVTQLNNYIKGILDSETLLSNVEVQGEVSSLRFGAGATFFVLKDESAQIECFYFGGAAEIKNGESIIVIGKPNFYAKGGKLSFNVQKIKGLNKQGKKHIEKLLLREKLEKEGLFDAQIKKIVPKDCIKIGVVSSATGAVIHDIEKVAHRRNPAVDIDVFDARVQGSGSELSIVKGIEFFSSSDVNVIIVARGGGSDEELSAFDAEIIVRAIRKSNKPVISAVGHETNLTLCDLASDLRAPTPSAAAELCTLDVVAFKNLIYKDFLFAFEKQMSFVKEREKMFLLHSDKLLHSLHAFLAKNKGVLIDASEKMNVAMEMVLLREQQRLEISSTVLDNNNPAKMLKKGFTVVTKNNKRVFSANELKKGDVVSTFFSDGVATSEVLKVSEVKNEL